MWSKCCTLLKGRKIQVRIHLKCNTIQSYTSLSMFRMNVLLLSSGLYLKAGEKGTLKLLADSLLVLDTAAVNSSETYVSC
jgi:hypothetical protein